MKIIGIDPGYERLGIAIIERDATKNMGKSRGASSQGSRDIVIYSNCFRTSAKDNMHKRLGEIGAEISRILEEYMPDAMSIETLFISNNQKTGMRVAEARGIIMYEAISRGIDVFEYSPMQIKTAITSDGSSDKTRMVKMVNLLVKLPSKDMLDDEYDAIAVALTHSAISR